MEALSASAFATRLKSAKRPLVVCCTRRGSAPSAALVSALEALPPALAAQIELVALDIDANADLMDSLHVARVPELLIYSDGKLVERTEGAMSTERVAGLLRYTLERLGKQA